MCVILLFVSLFPFFSPFIQLFCSRLVRFGMATSGERTNLLPTMDASNSRPIIAPVFGGHKRKGGDDSPQHWSAAGLSSAEQAFSNSAGVHHLEPPYSITSATSPASFEFKVASPFDDRGRSVPNSSRTGSTEACCSSRSAVWHSLQLVLFPLSMPIRAVGNLVGLVRNSPATEASGVAKWYLSVSRRGWSSLVAASMFFYVLIGMIIMTSYLGAAWYCGATHTTITQALYFFVVTFVANGGYMGEDPKFSDPTSTCYELRTYLVFCASYFSIGAAGVIAAMFVAKASQGGGMGHRIAFSDVILVTAHNNTATNDREVPEEEEDGPSSAKFTFRVYDTDARNPFGGVSSGALRMYLMTQSVNAPPGTSSPRRGHSPTDMINGLPTHTGRLHSFEVPVRCEAQELPWFCKEEAHGDRPLSGTASTDVVPTCKDLRLWFPATIDVLVGKDSPTVAQRELWRLYSSVAAHGDNDDGGGVPWYNFQVLCEFSGVDSTSGVSFVKRKVYYPTDIAAVDSAPKGRDPSGLTFAPMTTATVTRVPQPHTKNVNVEELGEMKEHEAGCGFEMCASPALHEGRRLRRFQRRRAALDGGVGMVPLPHNVQVDEDLLSSLRL